MRIHEDATVEVIILMYSLCMLAGAFMVKSTVNPGGAAHFFEGYPKIRDIFSQIRGQIRKKKF
jgi:hypothetical protein